jgi:hypothetical protein
MKAARLNGDLLLRKGDARPVPGFAPAHGKSTDRLIRPALAAVETGSAGPMPESAAQRPQGKCASDLKCDKFGRVRISLRLDPQRHLRLRLLAAHSEMSLQEALIAALDAYLGEEAQNLPCACLHDAGRPSPDDDGRDDNRDETRAAGVQDPE